MIVKRLLCTMWKALKALVMAPFAIGAASFLILWYLLCYPFHPNREFCAKRLNGNLKRLWGGIIDPLFYFAQGICEFLADLIGPMLCKKKKL